jgi:hypothetical protein
MQANTRTHSNHPRRRWTYLGPHDFSEMIRRRARNLEKARRHRVSWVSCEITMDDLLDDLRYGQD